MIVPQIHKHMPVGFHLKDWKWGPLDPSPDYYTITSVVAPDDSAPFGLRYRTDYPDRRRAGKPAGYVDENRAGTQVGAGRTRARAYRRVRVYVPTCVDPWAPRITQGKRPKAHLAAVVWLLTTGNWPPPHLDVDHIDVDATNNHPRNLRLLDRSGNSKNTPRCFPKDTACAST